MIELRVTLELLKDGKVVDEDELLFGVEQKAGEFEVEAGWDGDIDTYVFDLLKVNSMEMQGWKALQYLMTEDLVGAGTRVKEYKTGDVYLVISNRYGGTSLLDEKTFEYHTADHGDLFAIVKE